MVTAMRKKRLIVALTVGALLLTGCQDTPAEKAVVSKANFPDFTLSATQAAGEMPPSRAQYARDFTSTDGSVQFRIDLDQELPTGKMPVVEVAPRHITSEDCQRVARVLLGDVDFYEREPSSDPQYSKSQHQEMIARLVPYSNLEAIKDLVGSMLAEDMLESVKRSIAWSTEAMETAPEENPHTPCDWTLKKERVYNDSEWDIRGRALADDSDWLVATAEKDGMGYTYMVISRDQPDYKLGRFSIQFGGASLNTYIDRKIYWSKLCRTGEPTQQQIQDVQDTVLELLKEMDLGDWRIADTQIEIYETGGEQEYMLRVYAVPVFYGVSAVYGQKNTTKEENYSGAYVLTEVCFLMSANGDLIDMQLDSPLEVTSLVNENAATLSFPQLMERAEQHLSLSDAGNYGANMEYIASCQQAYGENIQCYVEINQMEYGLARIMAENTTEIYYYVPALMLRADIEYRGETTGNLYYSYPFEELLCINAIDGSVI